MAQDITQAEPRPVHEPAAHVAAPPGQHPGHPARAGWLLPAGVAAVAAFAVGWVSGVRWAWREMGPRHRGRTTARR